MKFSAATVFVAVTVPHLSQAAPALKTYPSCGTATSVLPGIHHFGDGYNIVKGQTTDNVLLDVSSYKSNISVKSHVDNKCYHLPDAFYSTGNGIGVDWTNSWRSDFSNVAGSTAFDYAYKYASKNAAHYSASVSGFGDSIDAAYSQSASVNEAVKQSGTSYSSVVELSTGGYIFTLSQYNPIPSKIAKEAWAKLAQPGATYLDFETYFNNFGTHYVYNAGVGGELKFVTTVKTDSSTSSSASLADTASCFSAKAKVEYLGASVNAQMEACKNVETSTAASKNFTSTVGHCSVVMKGGAAANVVCGGDPKPDMLKWKQKVLEDPVVVETESSEMKWVTTLLENDYVGKQQFIDQTFQSNLQAYNAFVAKVKTSLQAYLKANAVCDVYTCPKQVPAVFIQNKKTGNFLSKTKTASRQYLNFVSKSQLKHRMEGKFPFEAMWYYLPQHEVYVNYQDPTVCLTTDGLDVITAPCAEVWNNAVVPSFQFKIDQRGWLTQNQSGKQTHPMCVREVAHTGSLPIAKVEACRMGTGLPSFQHLPVLEHKDLLPMSNPVVVNGLSNMKNITLAYNGTARYTWPWVPDYVSYL